MYRWIAAVLWVLAIAGEVYAIFGVLPQVPINMVLLIVLIVVIGLLAVGGNLLWRKANKLNPASEKNKMAFWFQNQLGAIITVIAFLPLIILILANKDMSAKQKALAGGIGIVVAAVAMWTGMEFNSNSVEQMTAEQNQIIAITGTDEVFWTKAGGVYHLCEAADYVNQASQDNTIYSGTIAQANAEGKRAPSQQTIKTESTQCGFEYISLEDLEAQLIDGDDSETDLPSDDATDEETDG